MELKIVGFLRTFSFFHFFRNRISRKSRQDFRKVASQRFNGRILCT